MLVACRLAGLSAVRAHVQFGPAQSPNAVRPELRASNDPGGAACLRHTQRGPQPRLGRRRGTLHSCGGEHVRPEVIPLGQTRVDPAVPDAGPYRTSVRPGTRLAISLPFPAPSPINLRRSSAAEQMVHTNSSRRAGACRDRGSLAASRSPTSATSRALTGAAGRASIAAGSPVCMLVSPRFRYRSSIRRTAGSRPCADEGAK
jgi:hypothetical protein